MENKAYALLAGLFTIALLVATILIALWLRQDNSQQVPYEMATTLSVPGLNPQAAVRYRGLEVGKVQSIDFDPKVPGQILVRIKVQADTPITKSTFGMLGYQGVTGIAYVDLNDDGSNPVRLPSSEDNVAHIEMRPSLFDNLQSKGLAILVQTEELTKRLNNLLVPANQEKFLAAFDNVSRAANELEKLPRMLQPTLAKLPALTEQMNRTLTSLNTLSDNASVLSGNLNTLTTTLQRPDGTLAKLTTTIDHVGAVANRFEIEVLPLAADARSTLRALNRTIESVRDNPQSLLFGSRGTSTPGPGEPGFAAPAN